VKVLKVLKALKAVMEVAAALIKMKRGFFFQRNFSLLIRKFFPTVGE
jgi:hypothetical protein